MSDRWSDRLSEYLDDELPPQQRRELADHLGGCAECAATLAELRQVVARAGSLPERDPAADLWPAIAAGIRGEAGAPEVQRAPAGSPAPTGWRIGHRQRVGTSAPPRSRPVFSFTLPQLAAAALAVALATAGVMWLFSAGVDARFGMGRRAVPATATLPADAGRDLSYDRAIEELRAALAAGRGELDSATVRVLEQNLTAIEQSIDQSRAALAADPANPYLREHLQETMRDKLALLQRATLVASAR